MSLMSALYVGSSGLQVSQNALNATGHNLSNVETEGYVRQQTLLKTRPSTNLGQNHISTLQTGQGVTTAEILQVRDAFLDKSYRKEAGRKGFYEAQSEAVRELEGVLGELEGVAFQKTLDSFWTSMQELAKEPDSLVAKATFVNTAVSFSERAENIYRQLNEYQLNLNTKIEDQVKQVNELGNKILQLNKKIMHYEGDKVENANDLRDQRNKLIDELSQIVKISYKEDSKGCVTVNVEGVPLVTEDYVYEMGTKTVLDQNREKQEEEEAENLDGSSVNSLMLIPIWPSLGGNEVFSFDTIPNSETDTDVGSLKGLLLARGTKTGRYTDIPVEPKEANYVDEYGYFDETTYEKDKLKYEEDVLNYNQNIDPSVLMSVQAMFDQLIHGVVTTVNDILSPNKEVMVPAGTTVTLGDGSTYTYEEETVIKVLNTEEAPVTAEGEAGIELFQRKSVERYLEAQDIVLSDGTTIYGARILNEEKPEDNYSLYTLGEITVNQTLLEDVSKVPLNSSDLTGDFDIKTAEKLISEWQKPFATLNPNYLMQLNFNDYYMSFTGSVATLGERMETIADSQGSMVNSIGNQRMSVHGVSSDEELTNLIRYQHAYNASSRYINVVNDMLEHIVTRL